MQQLQIKQRHEPRAAQEQASERVGVWWGVRWVGGWGWLEGGVRVRA